MKVSRRATALVRLPSRSLRMPATTGVTPLALSIASRISAMCRSSLGAAASPPNSWMEASGLSVHHIRPGRDGLVLEALDPLAQVHLERLERDPAGPVAEPGVELVLQRDQRLDVADALVVVGLRDVLDVHDRQESPRQRPFGDQLLVLVPLPVIGRGDLRHGDHLPGVARDSPRPRESARETSPGRSSCSSSGGSAARTAG